MIWYCTLRVILFYILFHTRFDRYDVHDTILLKHIHFGSISVMRWRFLKKKNNYNIKISKFRYSYVIVLYMFINNRP